MLLKSFDLLLKKYGKFSTKMCGNPGQSSPTKINSTRAPDQLIFFRWRDWWLESRDKRRKIEIAQKGQRRRLLQVSVVARSEAQLYFHLRLRSENRGELPHMGSD